MPALTVAIEDLTSSQFWYVNESFWIEPEIGAELLDMRAMRTLARSSTNERRLRELGAEPVRANLFDASSLRDAVRNSDAILHLVTHIPPSKQARRREAWRENDRVRIKGTRPVHAWCIGRPAANVARDVFRLEKTRGRRECHRRGAGRHAYGHEGMVTGHEVQLSSIVSPHRSCASVGRNPFLAPRYGKRLDEYFVAAGLVSCVSDPVTVRRNPAVELVDRCIQIRMGFVVPRHWKNPEIQSSFRCASQEQEILTIGRPA